MIIIAFMILFLTFGVLILLTGPPVATTPSYLVLTLDFISQALRQLTPFLKIGVMTTIGFGLQFASLLDDMTLRDPLYLPSSPREVSFFLECLF